MKIFTSDTQKIGKLGEDIACKYLLSKGFEVIERNFTRKWGEIDIIAKQNRVTHFVEVKSVSCESFLAGPYVRPEDQMHVFKQRRLIRTIESYLAGHFTNDWQFDVVCVYLNNQKRIAKVKVIEDVILSH